MFKGTKPNAKGIKVNHYATVRKDCWDCAYASSCKDKGYEKRVTVTYYKPEYERAIKRVESKLGQYMKKKWQSTVEPVFGTLTQFMGLRKVNTKGIQQANKVMLTSAVAYNIKKYLKFTEKLSKSLANQCQKTASFLINNLWLYIITYKSLKTTKAAPKLINHLS